MWPSAALSYAAHQWATRSHSQGAKRDQQIADVKKWVDHIVVPRWPKQVKEAFKA